MTDRAHSLIVVLEHDLRVDDAQSLIDAIGCLRGVLSVSPIVADPVSHMAERRARVELQTKVLEVIAPRPLV